MRGSNFSPGNRLVVYQGSRPLKVTLIALSETGKIRVRPGWSDHDDDELELDPNFVILEFPADRHTMPSASTTLRELLRGLWGNLMFGRVTRVVVRAQDCNIWYTTSGRQRQYLGDNKEVLKRFTRQEIKDHVTFEYDFYFGFCGALDGKSQKSRDLPFAHRAPDRVVEEDLEDLCILENHRTGSHRPDDGFHFSSTNFVQPLIMDFAFDPADHDQVLQTTTYSVIPPRMGDLICGVPVPSKRGISLAKWWIAPEPFYELWKLLQSDHPPCSYSDMKRLQWRQPGDVWGREGDESRFFQELAMCAVFGQTVKLSRKCQVFVAALNKLVE